MEQMELNWKVHGAITFERFWTMKHLKILISLHKSNQSISFLVAEEQALVRIENDAVRFYKNRFNLKKRKRIGFHFREVKIAIINSSGNARCTSKLKKK